jgi:branched-chain amino acid transport system ATP-binding protein
MAPAVELIDLHAGYGRIEVLHGVTFTVPTGSVFALLGPNGAGKSTTLQVISGKLRPKSGCVHIAGAHVNGASPDALTRAGVCRIPEGRGIFPNLTVTENLRMWTYGTPLSMSEVEERTFARFPRLGERRNQRAGTMSGGEQQMLALSRAFLTSPSVLLMDEISMGLAPQLVEDLFEAVQTLRSRGMTIVLVEQFLTYALRFADICYVLGKGRVAFLGEPAELRDGEGLAYLSA